MQFYVVFITTFVFAGRLLAAPELPGEWLDWSSWTTCSPACDTNIFQHRTRTCNISVNPQTLCDGSSIKTKQCSKIVCVDCPKPTLESGTVRYNSSALNASLGMTAKFTCNEEYRLEGINVKTCLATGKWEDDIPICVPAMYIGARVQRGKDWNTGNEDDNKPGTVVVVHKGIGWIHVKWDNNGKEYAYRMGEDNKYDVEFVPGTFNSSKLGQI